MAGRSDSLAVRPISQASWPAGVRAKLSSLIQSRTAIVSAVCIAGVVAMAVLAQYVAPHSPNQQHLSLRLSSPLTPGYPLGADHLGRDILSRVMYGSRISLVVGLTSTAIAGITGITAGLLSGYYGGRLDDIISFLANVQLSFPFILLAIAVVAVLGPGLRNLIIVLGLTSWVVYQRVVRGEVLRLRHMDFVLAATSIGVGDLRLLTSHILPNLVTPLIVVSSFEIARMIIAEAALSFLGLGVEPSIPSWGSMLADGRTYLTNAWWIATFPGLAITFTVMAINLLGDWLRDELDPRLQREVQ